MQELGVGLGRRLYGFRMKGAGSKDSQVLGCGIESSGLRRFRGLGLGLISAHMAGSGFRV